MKFDFSEIKYNGTTIRKRINLSDRPTPELAEIIGIMLGDGSLYLSKKLKYHTIVCFHKKETPYLDYVKNILETYFYPYKFRIQELDHEFFLMNVSKCVGKVLTLTGIKAGNKVKNKVSIPQWVFSDRKFIQSVLRGLFDTDGSVYRKYDDYAQICFKLAGYPLLESIRKALTKLSFNPTKIQVGHSYIGGPQWKFYLSRQGEIRKFFYEIKPANEKHLKRFENIKNGDAGI